METVITLVMKTKDFREHQAELRELLGITPFHGPWLTSPDRQNLSWCFDKGCATVCTNKLWLATTRADVEGYFHSYPNASYYCQWGPSNSCNSGVYLQHNGHRVRLATDHAGRIVVPLIQRGKRGYETCEFSVGEAERFYKIVTKFTEYCRF